MVSATEWDIWGPLGYWASSPQWSQECRHRPTGWAPHSLIQVRKWSERLRRTGVHHDHLKRVYEMLLLGFARPTKMRATGSDHVPVGAGTHRSHG
jgi:hypothetical protein